MNLEQCAIKTENKETYDIVYRNFSRNIHATDYMEFFIRQNLELIRLGPLYLEMRNKTSYEVAINSLTPMAEVINDLFRLGKKKLDKHFSTWVQCLGRAQAGKKRTRQHTNPLKKVILDYPRKKVKYPPSPFLPFVNVPYKYLMSHKTNVF